MKKKRDSVSVRLAAIERHVARLGKAVERAISDLDSERDRLFVNRTSIMVSPNPFPMPTLPPVWEMKAEAARGAEG